MKRWRLLLRRLDTPAPGRDQYMPDRTRLRQFVSAVTGQHTSGDLPPWTALRIDRFDMPTAAADGLLDIVWLPDQDGPVLTQQTVGRMFPVGPSVIGVAQVSEPEEATPAQLLAGAHPVPQVSMSTRSPMRLTRQVDAAARTIAVDVLYPSEDLILRSLINDWNMLCAPDTQKPRPPSPAIGDELEIRLRSRTILSGMTTLAESSYVVKRDQDGRPYFRRGITGTWSLRLLSDDADQQWFAALMRFAEIAGIGRDHGLGMGRVDVLTGRPGRARDRARPGSTPIPSVRATA